MEGTVPPRWSRTSQPHLKNTIKHKWHFFYQTVYQQQHQTVQWANCMNGLVWRIMNSSRVARSPVFLLFPLCIFRSIVILSLHWGKLLTEAPPPPKSGIWHMADVHPHLAATIVTMATALDGWESVRCPPMTPFHQHTHPTHHTHKRIPWQRLC